MLKKPTCASKQDVLELATLWYCKAVSTSLSHLEAHACYTPKITVKQLAGAKK